MKNPLSAPALLAAALAFQPLLPLAASARGPEGEPATKEGEAPGMFPERFAEKLSERMNLSADQKRKVEQVLEKSRPEMEKLKAEMKALHEKMRSAMARTKEAIRDSLTLEQKQIFDEMMARMARRMMGPPKGGGPGGRGRGRGKPGMKGGPRGEDAAEGPEGGRPPEDRGSDD